MLFNKLKLPKATCLKKGEFYSLLKTLDPDISEEEAHFVFTKFDQDGSGGIEFEEFKDVLKQNSIRLRSLT